MADHDDRLDLWFRRFRPAPDSEVQLICLPHAGGSASFFVPFTRLLAPSVEVVGVQYPGRQDRRAEPLIDDLHELADHVSTLLVSYLERSPGRPFALFGHSLGAALAFEVVRRLEQSTGPKPVGLIASGRRSPLVHIEETVHLQDDDGLLAEMRRLSGTEMELLDDAEFLQMILPVMRGDYRAIERYRYGGDGPVRTPISVLVGDADPRVSRSDAEAWQGLTGGGFDLRSFPGGHFYLNTQQPQVAQAVLESLRTFTASVPG